MSLTQQLKNSFSWNKASQDAFEKLKTAMIIIPILALPNFSKPIIIETDALDVDIGSKASGFLQSLICSSLTYMHKAIHEESALLAIGMTIRKWRPYG